MFPFTTKLFSVSFSLTTRPATRADLPVLLEFEQGIVAWERPFNPTLKPDPISYYDIGELIDLDSAEVVVALDGERIIGSGYVKVLQASDYVQPSEYAFLGFMFVDPDYRGQGVNRLVMDALLGWAKERGLSEVRLQVYSENASAIRAYEKKGFSPLLLEMRRTI
jgi:GNAT superfamily N-acetyltransferase